MSDEAGADRELWSAKAEHWDRHVGDDGDANRRQALHPVLQRMLGDVSGLRVLDAGCGTGYLSRKLARAGAEVLAVDYAEGMVEVARRRAREEGLAVEVRLDDCCRLDCVAPGRFDRLVSVYVLQDPGVCVTGQRGRDGSAVASDARRFDGTRVVPSEGETTPQTAPRRADPEGAGRFAPSRRPRGSSGHHPAFAARPRQVTNLPRARPR
jgi:SAM-dependent methyltransferase